VQIASGSTIKAGETVPYETKEGKLFGMDRRIQKTRQALQEALIALVLEKGYEALTVQDVLDRANVGRSTFYAHFYDLDDLLQSEFEHLQAEFEAYMAKHPAQEASLWDISRLMFQHARTYQQLYKAMVGKESGTVIQRHLQDYLRQQIRARLKGDAATVEILESYLISSFMGLLTWWLDRGMPYSAEKIAQIFEELSKNGINDFKVKS
jgi:AcrR family transcriptional regulator